MLTVYPDDREKAHLSIREGMMMEAEDYLQKPVDPQELLSRVEDLLKK
jgi:DNA-binding response OmpR family regulator